MAFFASKGGFCGAAGFCVGGSVAGRDPILGNVPLEIRIRLVPSACASAHRTPGARSKDWAIRRQSGCDSRVIFACQAVSVGIHLGSDVTYTIEQTLAFSRWLVALRDVRGRIVIGRRIERAVAGNLGDTKSIGEGVSEMRIDYGPGYRVYFTVRSGVVIMLLAGGDKSSQAADIRMAKRLAKEV